MGARSIKKLFFKSRSSAFGTKSMAGTWASTVERFLLLHFFIILSLGALLIDSQILLPSHFFPKLLSDLRMWYASEFDDYLLVDPPSFFVALVWWELLFVCRLSVACAYAILAGGRPWFGNACVAVGVSVAASMAAIMGEIMSSGKGSTKLLQMYAPFAALSTVAIIRGFFPSPSSSHRKISRKKKPY